MVNIIKKPIITEKSESEIELYNKYTFEVNPSASKVDIVNAIEKLYNVKVLRVNTLIQGGGKKNVKYTNKGLVYQKPERIKKAFVKLAEGDKIDFYSNI